MMVLSLCKKVLVTFECQYCHKIKRRRVQRSLAKKIKYCDKKCYIANKRRVYAKTTNKRRGTGNS